MPEYGLAFGLEGLNDLAQKGYRALFPCTLEPGEPDAIVMERITLDDGERIASRAAVNAALELRRQRMLLLAATESLLAELRMQTTDRLHPDQYRDLPAVKQANAAIIEAVAGLGDLPNLDDWEPKD